LGPSKLKSPFDSIQNPGELLLNPKLQAPPDLKIGPNKSQVPIIDNQNIEIKKVVLILQI